MRKLFILLLALLAIVAIAYFCVYKTHVPAIQKDIATRAQAALSNNGIASVEVNVEGRDITLTGIAPSAQIKQAAEKIAQIDGYNFINNQITVGEAGSALATTPASPDRSHSLAINLDRSGKITLDGILDKQSHKTLRAAAIKRYGETNVMDRVLELELPVAEGMPDVALLMIDKMSGLNTGEAMFIKNKINIKGTSPSKIMLSQVEQQLRAKTPKSYSLNLDLKVSQSAEVGKPVVQVNKKSCQKQFNRVLKTSKVRFNSSSAVVKKSSYRTLNKLVAAAKKCPGVKIKVHGHTDSSGRNSANLRLSKKRAKAVANYLAKKGIAKTYLIAVGHGSSKPIASNKTNKGRARNRRIELTVESIK